MRGLYKRDGSVNWYFRFEHMGTEYRRSTKTPNIREAKQVRDTFIRQVRASFGHPSALTQTWENRCQRAVKNKQSWLHKFRRRTQGRNIKFGVKQGISIEDLYKLVLGTNGRCAITDIPFEFDGEDPISGPFAISIDRIQCGKPYDVSNCRFVLRGVNYAMHTWGEEAFWQITKAAIAQKLVLD